MRKEGKKVFYISLSDKVKGKRILEIAIVHFLRVWQHIYKLLEGRIFQLC
jgi:hypothetical protein